MARQVAVLAVVAALLLVHNVGSASAEDTWHLGQPVSVGFDGAPASNWAFDPSVTENGRYVVFTSTAVNLVPGQVDGRKEVFVRDRRLGTTTLVSRATSGRYPNGRSFDGRIAGRGRYVVFTSAASNLIEGDTNGQDDVFVRDLLTQRTRRVSVKANGAQLSSRSTEPSISDDGLYLGFSTAAPYLVPNDHNGARDAFVANRLTGDVQAVSRSRTGALGDRGSTHPEVSGDGRFVVFVSEASDLVPNDRNEAADTFIHVMGSGATHLISRTNAGPPSAEASWPSRTAISDDGRYVAFDSAAGDLVADDDNAGFDVFVRDTIANTTVRVTKDEEPALGLAGPSFLGDLTGDGRRLTFAQSSTMPDNGHASRVDLVERDLEDGTLRLVAPDVTNISPACYARAGTMMALTRFVEFRATVFVAHRHP